MLCKNCGQVIEEGKAFCRACGAPAPTATTVPEAAAIETAALADTMVKPPVDVPTSPPTAPPPPPVFRPAPPPPPTFGPKEPPPVPAAFFPPASPTAPAGYAAGWQPPQGPPSRGGRAGLILGIVAAVIVVLAGAGVGSYFGFIRDGGGSADGGGTVTTKTTVAGSSTTSGSSTSTSVTPSTSAQTTSTAIGATTTQTVPGLTTTTRSSTTTTTEDPTAAYLTATDTMVAELEYDDGRIPELATKINQTAPNVPEWVRDELVAMQDKLDGVNADLVALDVPAGFENPDTWLDEAIAHMGSRIYATIQGIEAMWGTGKVSSSTPYFNKGRVERDAYRLAMKKYHDTVPID